MVGGLNAGEPGPGGGRTRRLKTPLRRARPATGIRSATSLDIAGTWRTHGGLEGSSLTIERADDVGYVVSFSADGCLDHWRLERYGDYQDCMLVCAGDSRHAFYLGSTLTLRTWNIETGRRRVRNGAATHPQSLLSTFYFRPSRPKAAASIEQAVQEPAAVVVAVEPEPLA